MSRASASFCKPCFVPALILASLLAGCGSRPSQGGPQSSMAARAVPVRVRTVANQPVGEFTDYLATLISRDSAVLQPEVEGQITRIFVHSGQHVKQGEPLLEINPLKQQATVRTTEANQRAREADLALAKQQLDRTQALFKEGIVPRQQLDQAQAAYDAAQANAHANQASIAEQQAQLHYFTVRAPSDGIVGDIPVHVGDHVTTQTQLTTVVAPGTLEAYIYVPAEKVSEAKTGLKVVITSNNTPPVTTRVSFVSPRVDPQSQLLLIKANVPNPRGQFRNDEEVQARVYWKQVSAPLIPVTSVTRLGGQAFAFVVEAQNGKDIVHQVPVQLGQIIANNYIVLGGIKAGDRVVVSDTQMLAEGMPVTATEAASS